MEDLFKKMLYAGIGLVSLASERVEQTVEELVERGKLSNEEGKKIIDEFFKNSEAKKEEFEEKFKEVTESIASKVKLPNNTEVDGLRRRVVELEAKLAEANATTVEETAEEVVAE